MISTVEMVGGKLLIHLVRVGPPFYLSWWTKCGYRFFEIFFFFFYHFPSYCEYSLSQSCRSFSILGLDSREGMRNSKTREVGSFTNY